MRNIPKLELMIVLLTDVGAKGEGLFGLNGAGTCVAPEGDNNSINEELDRFLNAALLYPLLLLGAILLSLVHLGHKNIQEEKRRNADTSCSDPLPNSLSHVSGRGGL